MLLSLRIEHFALIDEVQLNFEQGFSVFTGETGSGKSIILAATHLILGERADLKVIAPGAKKAIVEAQFQIPAHLKAFFAEHELDYEEQTLIRREILQEGKSRAFINDTPVQLQVLKALSAQLIQVHSQYNTFELKSKSYQLTLLDTLLGLDAAQQEFEQAYRIYQLAQQAVRSKELEWADLQQQQDFNAFMLQELASLRLQDPALDTLEQEIDRFENSEQLQLAYAGLANLLQENGVYDQLYRFKQELEKPRLLDSALQVYYERLQSMLIEIKEIAREADSFTLGSMDQEQQQKMLQWQDQINASLLKHRVNNIAELRAVFEQLQMKVGSVTDLASDLDALKVDLLKQKQQLEQQALDLHQRRLKGAPNVGKALQLILDGLKLPHTTLSFDLVQSETLSSTGFTQIQFLFSANLGHEPVAVEKAASGGELSRLMLALQKMVSEKKALPTIIFDEIDTGVSGEVALKMASLLQEMSVNGQCIAITHLPQVAAKASHHFKVSKAVNTDRMQTSVETLDASARRLEIARLMSGEEVTKAALAHADNLMRP